MNGAEVLSRFAGAGYTLALEAGEIRASGPAPPTRDLLALVEEDRDRLKAALLLEDPPAWLARLFDAYWSGHQTPVKLGNPASGKAETYVVRVSIGNIAAAVAAGIGMDPLQWEAIREEVAEALGSWERA